MTRSGKYNRTPESIDKWRESRKRNKWQSEDYISDTRRPYYTPWEESWSQVSRTKAQHDFMAKGPNVKHIIPILNIMVLPKPKQMPQLNQLII